MVFFLISSPRKKKSRNLDYRHLRRHVFFFASFIVLFMLLIGSSFITPKSLEISEVPNSTNTVKYPSINDGTQYITSGVSTLDNGGPPVDPIGTGTALSGVNEYLSNDTAFNYIPVNNTDGSDYTGNESIYVSPLEQGGGRKDLIYLNFTTDRIANATEDSEDIEDGYDAANPLTTITLYAQELNVSTRSEYYYVTEIQLRAILFTTTLGSYHVEVRNSTAGEPSDEALYISSTLTGAGEGVGLHENIVFDLESEKLLLKSNLSYYVVVVLETAGVQYYKVDDASDPDYGLAYQYTAGVWASLPVDLSVEHVEYQEAFYADTTTDDYDDLNMNVTIYGAGVNGPYAVNPSEGGSGGDWWIGGQVSRIFSPGDVSPTASGTFEFDIDVDDDVSPRNLTIDFNATVYYLWDDTTSTGDPTYSVLSGTDVTWNVTYDPSVRLIDPSTPEAWYDYFFVIDELPNDWNVTVIRDNNGINHTELCEPVDGSYVNITRTAIGNSTVGEDPWTVTCIAPNYVTDINVLPSQGTYTRGKVTLDIHATISGAVYTGSADMNFTQPGGAVEYPNTQPTTGTDINFDDYPLPSGSVDGAHTISVLWVGSGAADNRIGYLEEPITIEASSSGNGGNGGGDGGGSDGGGGDGGGGDGTGTSSKTFTVTPNVNLDDLELEAGTTGTITMNVTGSGFVSDCNVSLIIGEIKFDATETNNSYVIDYDLIDHVSGNYTAKLTVDKTGFATYTKLFDVLVSPMTTVTAMRVYAVQTTDFVQENWLLSTTWFIIAMAFVSIILIVYVRPLNSNYLFDLYIFDRNNMAIYKQNFTPIETLLDPELPKEGIDGRKAKEELKEQAITGITGLLKELTTEETKNIDLKTLRISMDGKDAKVAVWTKQASSILKPFVNYKVDRFLRKLRHKFEEYYYVDLKLSKPGVSEYLNIPSVFLESFKLTSSPELYNLYIEYAEYLKTEKCPVLESDAYYKALRICVKEQMRNEIDSCYIRLLKSLERIHGMLGITKRISFLYPTPEFSPHNFTKLHILFKATSLFRDIRKRKELKYIRSRWIAETSRRAATDLIQPEVVASVKSKNYPKALAQMDQAISLLDYAHKLYTKIKMSKEAEAVLSVLSTFTGKRNELFEMSAGFNNTVTS